MAMYNPITDSFTYYESVNPKKVAIEFPLMDKPEDISSWADMITPSGNVVVSNPTEQKKEERDVFKAWEPEINRVYNISNSTTTSDTNRTLTTKNTLSKGNATAVQLMDKLIERGIKPHEAAAIVGHMGAESELNPSAFNGNDLGSQSGGLGQWRGDRLTALKNYAKSKNMAWTNVDLQADYLIHELQNKEKDTFKLLQSTTNPSEASKAWSYYERFAGYDGTTKTAQKLKRSKGWTEAQTQKWINEQHEKREKNSEIYYEWWKQAHQA